MQPQKPVLSNISHDGAIADIGGVVFGFLPWLNLGSMVAQRRHTRIWQHHTLVGMAGFWLSAMVRHPPWTTLPQTEQSDFMQKGYNKA